jgi:hypothetical protein
MLTPYQLQTLAREKMRAFHQEAQTRQALKERPLRATWEKENDKLRIIWVGQHATHPIIVQSE